MIVLKDAMFYSRIFLSPSFARKHVWTLKLRGNDLVLSGHVVNYFPSPPIASARIQRTVAEFDDDSLLFLKTKFDPTIQPTFGFDGMTIDFSIRSAASEAAITLWSDQFDKYPDYTSLLKFCWNGLYGMNADYNCHLEDLVTYLGWHPCFRVEGETLRFFEHVSILDMMALKDALGSLFHCDNPVIDMRKTRVIARDIVDCLIDFSKANTQVHWLVNPRYRYVRQISRRLERAGIGLHIG